MIDIIILYIQAKENAYRQSVFGIQVNNKEDFLKPVSMVVLKIMVWEVMNIILDNE